MLRQIRRGGAQPDRLILTRNRRVMASMADEGKTLRLHEVFRSAPGQILTTVGVLFSSRSATARSRAKAEIRAFLEGALAAGSESTAPPRRHTRRPNSSDLPQIERLKVEFDRINREGFGGRLPSVPIRLSGRMRRRNGQFSTEPLEIAISRALCSHGAEGEAESTLRHEMIHLWQWVEGRKPGHGSDFRRWAKRLDIHPRATRSVCWSDPPD